ncbi:hypothetical protein FDECE_7099 [Fusarium decemcellulare]|nr:hypothetical protein FDECE_7099 [Fusarium decemcellulare]
MPFLLFSHLCFVITKVSLITVFPVAGPTIEAALDKDKPAVIVYLQNSSPRGGMFYYVVRTSLPAEYESILHQQPTLIRIAAPEAHTPVANDQRLNWRYEADRGGHSAAAEPILVVCGPQKASVRRKDLLEASPAIGSDGKLCARIRRGNQGAVANSCKDSRSAEPPTSLPRFISHNRGGRRKDGLPECPSSTKQHWHVKSTIRVSSAEEVHLRAGTLAIFLLFLQIKIYVAAGFIVGLLATVHVFGAIASNGGLFVRSHGDLLATLVLPSDNWVAGCARSSSVRKAAAFRAYDRDALCTDAHREVEDIANRDGVPERFGPSM